MIKKISMYSGKNKGAILIIFALVIPGALAIIGLLIDIGYQLTTKSQIYSLATAGAHAGATAVYQGEKATKTRVVEIIKQNNSILLKDDKNIDVIIGYYNPNYSRFTKTKNNTNAVQVSITKDNLLPFSSFIMGKIKVSVIAYRYNNKIVLTK